MRILFVAVLAINSACAIAFSAEDAATDDVADKAIGTVVKSLNDQDPKVRAAAKLALVNLRTTAVPQLVKTVENGDPQQRTTALELLLEIGTETKEAVPILVSVSYTDVNERNRSLAERVLEQFSDRQLEVQQLIALLQRDDKAVRRLAVINALTKIGPLAKEAVPQLLDELSDEDEMIRGAVINAISQTGVDEANAEKAIEALIKALAPRHEPGAVNRAKAANALGALGSQAKDATGSLISAYRAEESVYNKKSIVYALGRIGVKTDEVVATLEEARTHESERGIRILGVEALRQRSEEGELIFLNEEEVILLLIEALKDDIKILEESRDAADALVAIGAPAVTQLTKVLQSADAATRVAAAYALGNIGTPSQPALVMLTKAMQDDDEYVRLESVRALAQIVTATTD
ncbi:MAG: HEAT repeat domain-containing protein [Pirellulaceae bacterium]|nr:HEAT repeat domain-containing protein [Pirellulaceae bacterium]